MGQSRALRRGQLRDLSSLNVHRETCTDRKPVSFFFVWEKTTRDSRTESRPQQRSLHPNLVTTVGEALCPGRKL